MTVYSYSALKKFQECPRSYFYERVLKLRRPPSPAMVFGNKVHNAIERGIKALLEIGHWNEDEFRLEAFSGDRISDDFTKSMENVIGFLRDTWDSWDRGGMHAVAEWKWAVDRDFRMVGFKDESAMFRGVIDFMSSLSITLVDWKTGSTRYDSTQLDVYAMAARLGIGNPQLTMITAYFYTNTGEVEMFHSIPRKDADIKSWIMDTIAEIERLPSEDVDAWEPRQNQWCDFCPWQMRCPLFAVNQLQMPKASELINDLKLENFNHE